MPDAIVAAGGVAVGPAPGAPSPYATWDEIRSLAPDAVVVAPCGFDLARTGLEAAPVAETLRGLAPRVLLMDGNAYLNRPGAADRGGRRDDRGLAARRGRCRKGGARHSSGGHAPASPSTA